MSADVVVLGAGVIGASIGYHLARQGVACTIVDPRHPGEAPTATWASAGGLRSQGRAPADAPLTTASAVRWPTLSDELEADLEVVLGGHLHVAEREEELAALEARVAADRANGIAIELLDHAALHEVAPSLSPRAIAGALTAGDGQAHPGRTAAAFAAAAQRNGASLRFGQSATPIAGAGGLTGVRLDSGEEIAVDTVVLSAGAWSIGILDAMGIVLPIRWRGLQMLLSEVAPPLLAPTITAVGRNLSLKQSPSGQMMIGGRWWARSDPGEPATAPIDGHTARQWSMAVGILPVMANLRLAQTWAGVEAQSVDWSPFIGRTAIDGLYLATGFSTHGFQISPAVGALVAEDITRGAAPLLAPFAPDRPVSLDAAGIAAFRAEGYLL
jgi:sarcosine oxidase subunit beta